MDNGIKEYMNANWHHAKGLVKQKWGELTDDELKEVEGREEKLVGILVKRFNMTEQEAKDELNGLFRPHMPK